MSTSLPKAADWLFDVEMHHWRQERLDYPREIYLDRITPIWQAFFRRLPAQPAKVLWTLCRDFKGKASVKDLARYSRIKDNTLRSMLSRLKKLGIVEVERGQVRWIHYYKEVMDWIVFRQPGGTPDGDLRELAYHRYAHNLPERPDA